MGRRSKVSPAGVGVGSIPYKLGQARRLRVVMGAEPLVAYVHIGEAAVHLVAAVIEPPADVLAVILRGGHSLFAVGCKASLEGRSQTRAYFFLLGLQPQPVFFAVLRDAPLGLLVAVGLSPAPLCLFGVVLGAKLAEDLEALFWRKPYVHRPCLHFVFDSVDHRAQALHPLDEQLALAAQVPKGISARVVDDSRDFFEVEPKLPVEKYLL